MGPSPSFEDLHHLYFIFANVMILSPELFTDLDMSAWIFRMHNTAVGGILYFGDLHYNVSDPIT